MLAFGNGREICIPRKRDNQHGNPPWVLPKLSLRHETMTLFTSYMSVSLCEASDWYSYRLGFTHARH